jgi:hypothetical protein
MAKSAPRRGRPRVTRFVGPQAIQYATNAVKRGESLVAFAAKKNFNYVELATAVKASGVTLVRGRKATA